MGHFRLTAGDQIVIDTDIALPPDSDIAEAIFRPPEVRGSISLEPGTETDLVLRYRAADDQLIAFRLGVEPPLLSEEDDLDRAIRAAAESDVALVVVGTTEEVESEGFDRDSLSSPGRQDELVRRVAAANPRTIVVVNSGAPVLMPWAENVPAVLVSWFPGQEFGNALADVLRGLSEPGGRLPTTGKRVEEISRSAAEKSPRALGVPPLCPACQAQTA